MTISISKELQNADWSGLSNLYQFSDFGFKSPERLQTVFSNSQYKSFAYANNALIGAARAFSDGMDCSVVCDVVVAPEHQNKGFGKQLMKHLLGQMGEYDRIMLFSTLGKEAFYQKVGFGIMTTGMCIFKNQATAIDQGYIVAEE